MPSAKKERLIGVMIVHNLALGNHQFGLTFSKKGIGQTSSRIGFPWTPKTYQNMMVLNSISNDPILGLYNLSIEVEDESYPTPRCSCCFILPAAGLPTVPFFVQRQFYSLQPTGAAGPAGKKGTCRDAHMVWCHCRTLTLRCTW